MSLMGAPSIRITQIQKIVADYYDIPQKMMKAASRQFRYAHPRQVAMYLCRDLTRNSLPFIGARFGDRDHTTVMHAVKTIRKRIKNHDACEGEVSNIRQRITDVTTDYARGFADMCWQHGCSSLDDDSFRCLPEQKPAILQLVWRRTSEADRPPVGWLAARALAA